MPSNKECLVIIDGLYHEAPLSTVVNVCGACAKKDECGDYQWAQAKLVPAEQTEKKDYVDELIEAGFEFEKYEGPSWKPEDRNII